MGQAQLQRLVEQFRRQAGLGIRVMSQRTQHLQGEAFEHVHQHLLVVGERQVEQPVRIGLARSLRLLRRTLAGQAEAGTAAAVEQFLEGFAKIEAIRPVGLGDTVQYSQGTALYIGAHGHLAPRRMGCPDHAPPHGQRL